MKGNWRAVPSVALVLALAFWSALPAQSNHLGVEIVTNFTGTSITDHPALNNGGAFIPPDTMGAIGPSHFMELINGAYAVYNRNGTLAQPRTSLDQFWTDAGLSNFNGFTFDPRVLYDHASNRWFAAAADGTDLLTGNNFLIAVSNTANPLNGWTGFKIQDPNFSIDFPMLGVDADGVYLASNNFDAGGDFADVTIVSIPKADLTAPVPTIANRTVFFGENPSTRGFSIQPAVDFGPSDGRGALLAVDNDFFGLLNRTNVLGAGGPGAMLSGTTDIIVPLTSFPPPAFQPDGTNDLDTDDDRFSGNVFEAGNRLWAAHTITVAGRAGIRWYEIDETTHALLQSGTIADPNHDYFYPSIAVSGDAVLIGYSRSGLDEFISSYASFGHRHGGVTTFGPPILLKAGVDNYHLDFDTGRNRWGDYSATTVDPTDPLLFWTIQEWAAGFDPVRDRDTWSTQITAIRVVPEPGTIGLLSIGLVFLAWRVWAKRRKAVDA